MAKALFIGNGIHRVFPKNAISWDNLLKGLSQNENLINNLPGIQDINLNNLLKPFPLAFEELIQLGNNHNLDPDERIKLLKEEIRSIFQEQVNNGRDEFNEFHEEVMASDITDVITSNYDFGFELAGTDDFYENKQRLADYRREKTANLRRSYSIGKKRVWHMHGELFDSVNHDNPGPKNFAEQSILMGYRHYAKSLTDMKDYIDGKHTNIPYIMTRLGANDDMDISWVDKFFTHDIDIFGFGLGFEEQDVWWLLNYRANKIRTNENRNRAHIDNHIRFIVRSYNKQDLDDLTYRQRVNYDKDNAIKEILSAMEVNVLEIEATDWVDFYRQIIREI
tara:strand:- start:901 stop:1908 length:1008 start_codon:yes stop_codon:yes gene_type:complete